MTKDWGLETFVTISSVAALIGGMGNLAYGPANAFLDALIHYRRSQVRRSGTSLGSDHNGL